RHFERCRDVAAELSTKGIRFALRTEMNAKPHPCAGNLDCLLVNTTGELRFFYEPAQVVFIGKSLTAEGGQNPIEPGALGKAMVFGPNMQNFAEITQSFLTREGAVQVRDAATLETAISELLESPDRRARLGDNARRVVAENLGAIDRTVEMI